MNKAKPCKGIGRAKGFEGCGAVSERRKFGLCPSCLFKWSQETESGKEWYKGSFLKKVDRITKKRRKEEWKKKKEGMKSIARLIQEARTPFQKWIRFRDANKPCISCGTTTSSIWDAGHFFKAEVYTGLIFDEYNVNKQCAKCNRFLGGNESEYRKGLVKKIGEEEVKYLEDKADLNRMYKFSREELIEIKKHYQKKLKDVL